VAVKKSELYSSLWSSCDELRGGMDASLYKDYVLTIIPPLIFPDLNLYYAA
jgi:type I restriction enzyme M protein